MPACSARHSSTRNSVGVSVSVRYPNVASWRQMSSWRKAIAIGAFSIGTFGLGFTLGGLIFGRWRRA